MAEAEQRTLPRRKQRGASHGRYCPPPLRNPKPTGQRRDSTRDGSAMVELLDSTQDLQHPSNQGKRSEPVDTSIMGSNADSKVTNGRSQESGPHHRQSKSRRPQFKPSLPPQPKFPHSTPRSLRTQESSFPRRVPPQSQPAEAQTPASQVLAERAGTVTAIGPTPNSVPKRQRNRRTFEKSGTTPPNELPPDPQRRSNWPTKATFPKLSKRQHKLATSKAPPCKEYSTWSFSTLDVGDNYGWGSKTKDHHSQSVKRELNDRGDGFTPAALDWINRAPLSMDELQEQVLLWLDRVREDGNDTPDLLSLNGIDITSIDDIVPTYWLPNVTDGMIPDAFWESVVSTDRPPPFDKDDLVGVQPWWKRYRSRSLCLPSLSPPALTGADPDETIRERVARELDEGNLKVPFKTDRRHRASLVLEKEERRRIRQAEQKQTRLLPQLGVSHDAPQARKIVPTMKFKVRTARIADALPISEIYKRYVQETCQAPEMEPITHDAWISKMRDVQANRLPFLVAFQPGNVIHPRAWQRAKDWDVQTIVVPDIIVGFAYGQKYDHAWSQRTQWRFAVETMLYTHPHHVRHGVGSCLMDKLLAMLDADYLERGGFDIDGVELVGCSPEHTISNVIMQIPCTDIEKLSWLWRWLEKWYGFKKAGELSNIGVKLEENVSLVFLQHITGCRIDPKSPPAN